MGGCAELREDWASAARVSQLVPGLSVKKRRAPPGFRKKRLMMASHVPRLEVTGTLVWHGAAGKAGPGWTQICRRSDAQQRRESTVLSGKIRDSVVWKYKVVA